MSLPPREQALVDKFRRIETLAKNAASAITTSDLPEGRARWDVVAPVAAAAMDLIRAEL